MPYKIAFFLTYIIPVLITWLFWDSFNFDSILALIGTICIYEIGYINNDIVTVQYETSPTIRLDKETYIYMKRTILLLCVARRMIAFSIFLILYYRENTNVLLYASMLILLDFFYALHNTLRSKVNLITLSCLVFIKYTSPVILFVKNSQDLIALIITTIFVYCVSRSIEHANKYQLFKSKLFVEYDRFRFVYYFTLCIVSVCVYLTTKKISLMLILSFYFFVYRFLCLLFIKKKAEYNNKEQKI